MEAGSGILPTTVLAENVPVSLALKLMRRRNGVDDVPDELEPDLRWWRRPDMA